MRVGFIGLGSQGAPMARRIVDAGHPLTIWARRPETVESFADTAATVARTPAELAANSDRGLPLRRERCRRRERHHPRRRSARRSRRRRRHRDPRDRPSRHLPPAALRAAVDLGSTWSMHR